MNPHPPLARRRPAHWLALAPALLITALLVGACAGSSDDGSVEPASAPQVTGSGDSSDERAALEGPREEAADLDLTDGLSSAYSTRATAGNAGSGAGTAPATAVQTRSVISSGTVTLQSKDVGQARFDVDKVIAEHRGEIADEQTSSDPKGQVERSRLVIRVPSGLFDEAMEALGEVADLRSAKRTSEDVTTRVIDTAVRVRAQEKSLERVEQLLARAQTLRSIIWIESQLTSRQAELDSLKSQQAFLADQTTLATITVFLERTPQLPPSVKQEREEAGFVAGLKDGWSALTTAGTAVATAVGAMLPFVVLLLLLGVPTWFLLRTLVRHRTARRPAAPLPAD